MKKNTLSSYFFITVTSFLLLHHANLFAASPWPASAAIDVTGELETISPYFETSGITWHPRLDKLIVVSDEGEICTLDTDGSNASCVDIGSYDLEAVTIADEDSHYIYLGLENPNSILEFDLTTQSLTGKSWNLTAWMTGDSNLGLEALTFVPNDGLPSTYSPSSSGGLFYAGLQANGKVYVFDADLSSTNNVSYVTEFTPKSTRTDIADLYYSTPTQTLYVSYDANDRLLEINSDGTILNDYNYSVTGSNDDQEGVTLIVTCDDSVGTLYVAEDSGSSVGPQILSYSNYPVDLIGCEDAIIDNDGDGVSADTDCNDSDASVSSNQTYYQDADSDGMGNASSSTAVCANTAPSGYVSNSSDANDVDYDNDGTSTSSDCNDSDASISVTRSYYRDADGDSLGDPANSTSVCASTAPSGYVTNSDDTNDSGTTATSPFEIGSNGVDDDGDRIVDEVNTVAENGYHPTYATTNPSSTSSYRSAITSITGTTNGAILVTYADLSVYSYSIFSVTTTRSTSVRSWYSTGYLVVRDPTTRLYAFVNAYTGQVYYTYR